MDKRTRKPVEPEAAVARREAFYKAVADGSMSIGDAVVAMRKISRLTQPEFAKHRGISVQALRQIENRTGNPTINTLNKIASIFGLQVGFVPRPLRAHDAVSTSKAAGERHSGE
jgi:transcriptional regulator with XRE-family HTH domain